MKVTNIKEVDTKLGAVISGINLLLESDGQDMVKTVRNDVKPEGQRISKNSELGQPREALFEAAYIATLNNDKDLKDQVDKEMTEKETNNAEDEIVDRFLRDFLNSAFGGV